MALLRFMFLDYVPRIVPKFLLCCFYWIFADSRPLHKKIIRI